MPKSKARLSKPYSNPEVLKLARPSIQALKPYVPGRSIEDVRAQYNPPRIVKLGSNENPLGANPKVLKAIAKAMPRISLYPDGSNRKVREAIAEHYGVKIEQVMVGNGSDEVLLMIAQAFVKPGERVIVSENTFSEYEFSGRVLDGEIIKIPLRDFRYDVKGFIKALTLKPKLLFLCNPNNPTGNYFTQAELETLLRKTPRECLVVVDEAYADFSTAKDFPRCLELMKKHPNLLVSRTFSKLYGMAGMRLGYGFGDPAVIRETLRVKTPFNLNLLVQTAALTALKDRAFVKRSLAINQKGKSQLEAGFKKLGLPFLPTQANFICFRVSRPAVNLCEDLIKRGVIIRPLKTFGMPEWCRVTIGTADQNRFFLYEVQSVL